MKYPNDEEYDGMWRNGIKEGQGRYLYQNGDVFVGRWKADKREGPGVYTSSNGLSQQVVMINDNAYERV